MHGRAHEFVQFAGQNGLRGTGVRMRPFVRGFERAGPLPAVQVDAEVPDDVVQVGAETRGRLVARRAGQDLQERILRHVGNAEEWYVSRLVAPESLPTEWQDDEGMPLWDFLEMERRSALDCLRALSAEERAGVFYPTAWTSHPDEAWTLRKVLRRFHVSIDARSISHFPPLRVP